MPRRMAFLVGINNYANPKYELSGCINDIDSLTSILIQSFAFAAGDIARATDGAARKADIVAGLSNMLSGASAGDNFVFAYSGHGCQKPATVPGVQPNDMSDALVPFEATYDSLLTDADLFSIITRSVTSPAIKFTAIYDCCHSGTMIRDVTFDPATGELVPSIQNRCIFLPELAGVARRAVNLGPYNVFSACGDMETAADVRTVPGENRARGAFSYAIHQLIRGGPISIAQLDAQTKPLIQGISTHIQNPEFYAVDPTSTVFA